MKVIITGGGGFLGFRLAKTLLARGNLGGRPIASLTLLDGAFPPAAAKEPRLKTVTGDVSDARTLAQVCPPDTDAVFHLAAVVSGAAEADFDLGMRVNLKGTELLLETMRRCTKPPRLVYTSSVAAFGGELPAVLDDGTIVNPQTMNMKEPGRLQPSRLFHIHCGTSNTRNAKPIADPWTCGDIRGSQIGASAPRS